MNKILIILFVFASYYSASQEIDRKFFVSAEIGLGPGKSQFSYRVDEQAPGNAQSAVVKREFSSDFFHSRLSLSAGYRLKNFGLGFTSIIGTQKDTEVVSIVTRENGSTVKSDGVENWPRGKSYFGVFLEYDWKIAEDISFSPRLDLLKYWMPNNQTFIPVDTFTDSSFGFNDIFESRKAVGISGRLKFYAREGQHFFIGFNYIKDFYKLSKTYVLESFSNMDFQQNQSNIIVGYQFSF